MLTIRQLHFFQDATCRALASVLKGTRTVTSLTHADTSEQKPRLLSISLPDLSERETCFIRKQIDIISNPQCISSDRDFENDESDRRLFERIFPSSKEQRNLVACVRQIQNYYPNFKVPRRKTDFFNRHMVSPILSQRTADGLRFCGIKEGTLLSNPEWILFSNSSYLEEAELVEKADVDIADMINFARLGDGILRGRFISSYVEKLRDSLVLLNMEDAAEMLAGLNFNTGFSLTVKHFFNICNQPVIECIARRQKLPGRAPKEALFMLKDRKSPAVSPIKIARNFYISEEILKSHPKNFRSMRIYWSPEPIDSLIMLNSFYETLKDQLGVAEAPEAFLEKNREVCSQMVAHAPKHLPIPIRLKLLLAIGFSKHESADILCCTTCQKFSDNQANLVYSSPNYIEEMKSRLRILRNEGPMTASEAWSTMIHWSSIKGVHVASDTNDEVSDRDSNLEVDLPTKVANNNE